MKTIDLFNIENPIREDVINCLFRHEGWQDSRYSGLYTIDFGIKESDVVLDIGGCGNPYPRANYVLDKYPDNSSQRFGRQLNLYEHQTLVVSDAANLPFKDKSIDFIFSSHTIEHITKLPKALEEMSRVGRRGFIAAPGNDFHLITDLRSYGHKWVIRYESGILKIRRKKDWEYCTELTKFHEKFHINNLSVEKDSLPYSFLWEELYRYIWEIRMVWKDKIKYELS